ncbi:MAG: PDZ domain-containing protein [Caldilineaceae bacterium]|nr:PDZ domain-containing protein [Caldilineaceae bacterium]
MKQLTRKTGDTPLRGRAHRKFWILLTVAMLALLAWGGTVSASSLAERIKPEPGVLIVAVGDETPASGAGLQRGDILLAIDGDMVNTAAELRHVILMRDPGDTLELTVKRGDEELTMTVTLADNDGYPLLGVAPNVASDVRMRSSRWHFSGMRGFGPSYGRDGNRAMKDFRFGAGATVMEVQENSPAATAGLMADDVITAVDETEITGMKDLVEVVAAFNPGDEVELTVDRDGESVKLNVTLGAHPDDEGKAFFGVRISLGDRFQPNRDRSDFGRRQPDGNRFSFPFSRGRFLFSEMLEGALVMGVQDEGPAAQAELQGRDVITALDETTISSYEDLVAALADYSPGDEVTLTVDRDGEATTTSVTLGAHPDDNSKAYLGVSIMPLERFRMRMQENSEQADEKSQRQHASGSDS